MQHNIIKYFAFAHLPVHLQLVSKPIGDLAEQIDRQLPDGPEKSAGMRKLLEAKDCFVRAALDARAVAAVATNVKTITFDEFVQYGRDQGGNIVGNMPWSFSFHGHPVTHENDRCYIIANGTLNGLRFTPEDVLVLNPDGTLGKGTLVTTRAETPTL